MMVSKSLSQGSWRKSATQTATWKKTYHTCKLLGNVFCKKLMYPMMWFIKLSLQTHSPLLPHSFVKNWVFKGPVRKKSLLKEDAPAGAFSAERNHGAWQFKPLGRSGAAAVRQKWLKILVANRGNPADSYKEDVCESHEKGREIPLGVVKKKTRVLCVDDDILLLWFMGLQSHHGNRRVYKCCQPVRGLRRLCEGEGDTSIRADRTGFAGWVYCTKRLFSLECGHQGALKKQACSSKCTCSLTPRIWGDIYWGDSAFNLNSKTWTSLSYWISYSAMVHTQIPNSRVAIIERTLDFELHLRSHSRPTITDCETPTKALLPSLNFTSQTKKTTYALST